MFPTVVIIGSFLVPVAYVSFFYERRTICNVTMPSTAMCFFYGGILGTFAASSLEPFFIKSVNFKTTFIIGLIEELSKILGVLLIARHKKHNSTLDGIILGAAAGMGFAAFESTGYAFTGFLQSGGSLSYTLFITLLRGITSPIGHGTWTAIFAGVLFKESYSGKFNFNIKVLLAYASVVALHGLWDILPSTLSAVIPFGYAMIGSVAVIGIVGFIILYKQWREAKVRAVIDCAQAEVKVAPL